MRGRFALGLNAAWTVPLAAWTVAVTGCTPAASTLTVGKAAPPLVIKQLNGQPYDLGALTGKVVIVNFWATWCPPCRSEIPVLDAFYRQHHGQVEMIGVSADRARDRQDVLTVAQSFSYPAAMLSDATTDGFGSRDTLPLTVVIDRTGVIRATFEGPVTEKGLDDAVLPLMVP